MKLTIPGAWRLPLLQLGLLSLVLGLAQWPALRGMALLWWRSDTFAHGMLVLPISLWLVWRGRAALTGLVPRFWAPGLVPLALAVLAAAVGVLTEVNALQHIAFVLSLQALVLLCLGLQVGRALAFPLLFLLFAPPFGDFLVEPMMVQTADFVVGSLHLLGIPVYREGLHFVIPSGHWSVVEACSGLRYLFASVMVGTLFAYLNFSSLRRRLAFIGVAIAVPVLANWVRALIIVLLGHFSDNRIATGADHLIYGWLFFGFIMLLMFWVGGRWADASAPTLASAPAAAVPPAALRPVLGLLTALLLVLPAWGLSSLRQSEPSALASDALARLAPPAGWQALPATELPWTPRFVGPSLHRQSHWQRGAQPAVTLDLAFYSAQREESKAVNSMNQIVPAEDVRWARRGTEQGSLRWSLRGGAGDEFVLVRRLYWVDGRFTPSERQAKLLGLWQLLRGQGDAQAVLVMMTPAVEGGGERLDAFWQAWEAPLNERLRELASDARQHNSAR